MLALLDYDAGNLTSVRKALAFVGAEVFTPSGPEALSRASGIVVPGVGHFEATAVLDAAWREAVRAAVSAGTPLLGICLGLQWLFEGSEEAPGQPGLGLLPGHCSLLKVGPGLKVPHVGWNALSFLRPSRLLEHVDDGAQAYFTHSFVAPVTDACVATTTHGVPFASVVERGVVFGAQFHPEKSGTVGLRLIRNFLAVVRGGG
ncbi:MAG: imidazole glycerol phosphate synthase subunit HisH [Vicinamibacterales bacterium]|jgi:glutamine amidotransferase|nr:imidazole glycerol phosphate synthase subunit HisH [Vicinamibacterales bacterium]